MLLQLGQTALRPLPVTVLLTFLLVSSNISAADDPPLPGGAKPRVGLGLSGGGARGIAHIGVIMALQQERIPIDLVAGTSMGSIVGGLYAAGYDGEAMRKLVKDINWTRIFSEAPVPEAVWVSNRYGLREPIVQVHFRFWGIDIPLGLTNGQRIGEELFRLSAAADFAARSDFDSLRVPYRTTAVDVSDGKLYTIRKGSLAQAMRASMAMPLLFYPAVYGGHLMVDGGVLNVLPTDIVRQMGADVVIAVDVTEKLPGEAPRNLIQVAKNSVNIMVGQQVQRSAALADVLISPKLGGHSDTDYSGLDSLVELGYRAAMAKMDTIKRLVGQRSLESNAHRTLRAGGRLEGAMVSRVDVTGYEFFDDDSSGKKRDTSRFARAFSHSVRKGVVTSYFPLKKGDRFHLDLALQGIQNLYATGLVENVWLELENLEDERVAIDINYTQGSHRTLGLGANYQSEEGPSFFAQLVPFNLFGMGARFMPLVRFGRILKRAGLEISNSRFLATRLTYNSGVYYEQEAPHLYNGSGDRLGQFDMSRAVAQLSFGLQPYRKLLFALGLRGERVWLQEKPDVEQKAQTVQHLSPFGQLLLDSRDNEYLPTGGVYLNVQAETVTDFHRRGKRFSKTIAALDWTHRFPLNQLVTPYLRAGFSRNGLPTYEKFRIGGPRELPGYHRHEIWANHMLVAGVRQRWRFYKQWSLQTFWSAVHLSGTLGSVKLDRVEAGGSVGFVVQSAIGPASISYGRSESGRDEVYFSIGYRF